MSQKTLFVHDVWDGKLASELEQMSLGLNIKTCDAGYSTKRLGDYVGHYKPAYVAVSTPTFDWPMVQMYDRYLQLFPNIPMIFIINQKLLCARQSGWNLFWPKRELVTARQTMTGLSLIGMLNDVK